jgi:hypothetical protein
MNGKQDNRVVAYDFLTDAEVEDTRRRLRALAKLQAKHSATIDELIGRLHR